MEKEAAPAIVAAPKLVTLWGGHTTINDIRPLLNGPYVVFLREPTGWDVVVDLESNKEVDDMRAIPPKLPFSWALPRGRTPHLVLKKYVLKAQAQERANYEEAAATLNFFKKFTRFEVSLETSGEVDKLRLLTQYFEGTEASDAWAAYAADSFTTRTIPLMQSVLPCAEGDPEVPAAPPVLDEGVTDCLSVMKKGKLQSLEELSGWIAVQKVAIREYLENDEGLCVQGMGLKRRSG